MYAKNFFIALYDEERQLTNWPYYVDEIDADIPDPNKWYAFGRGGARSDRRMCSAPASPSSSRRTRLEELVARGEIELVGHAERGLARRPAQGRRADRRRARRAVVHEGRRYTEQDNDLLAFVGQHVGAALSRARAIEETRQRNAELALINSVQ